jgi:hypothetical protein
MVRATGFSKKQKLPATTVVKFLPRGLQRKAHKAYAVMPDANTSRRTIRHRTPRLTRLGKVTRFEENRRVNGKKVLGFWQTRSARAMLAAERGLSAWSPQLSTRNRRQHYPRVNGVPLPRRRLGFKAKRERHLANVRRLARGVPQIRYVDYMPVKLQYFYGSVASAGYVRFRRVHRMHSEHSR